MVHRGIATLAGIQVICFFLLSHFEPQFFLLHFYQSLMFLLILLMLFYFEDHWAYMLGMLAPATWLVLSYLTGLLGAALRQIFRILTFQPGVHAVGVLAALTAVLAVCMIVSCAYRWKREFSGLHYLRRTLPVSLAFTLLFYGILVYWFWNTIPRAVPAG